MAKKTITGIDAFKYKRGGKRELFSFSGVEAQEHIDEYMEEVRMTKDNLDEYQSNASAYASAAEASKESAAGSASSAKASATAAATSATQAANSATASADSASASKASATSAAESEAKAKSYADRTSEVEDTLASAEKVVEEAKTVADDISKKVTTAVEASSAAVEAANTATAQATSAKSSATKASTSEENAKASEENASASATQAANIVKGVNEVASAASASATAAATSEENAKASETAAAKSADVAEGYANSNYAVQAKSYAVGGTGTRDGEDTDNAAYYYNHIKDTDVGNLAELEKLIESNLNAINHDQSTYPAFVADRLSNVTDLNSCTTNGIYQFTAVASNNPVSAIGLVLVLNSTGSGEDGHIAQYAWAASAAHTVYARDDHGGTWGEWKKLSADVDTELSATSENAVQNKAIVNGGSTILNALGKTIAVGTNQQLTSTSYFVAQRTNAAEFKSYAITALWTYITERLESSMGITKDTFDAKAESSDVTALTSRVSANEGNIETIQTDLTSVVGKVATLIGSDASKSVRSIAIEALTAALIPSTAQESMDTLEEIAAWIQEHPDDAAAMSQAIEALKTRMSSAETSLSTKADTSTVTALATTVSGKADKATTLAGYGITDGATQEWVTAQIEEVANGSY